MLSRNSKSRHHEAVLLQLQGYRLATAEIIYHMPDHPHLLQTFIWQQYDLAPDYPVLHRFLDFWHRNLDGPIHTVRVASTDLIKPAEIHTLNSVLHLH